MRRGTDRTFGWGAGAVRSTGAASVKRASGFSPFGERRSLNWLRPCRGGYAAISKAAISVAADLRDTLAAGARGAS